MNESNGKKHHDAWSLYRATPKHREDGEADPHGLTSGKLVVIPYVFKDFDKLVTIVGLRPDGSRDAIPRDVRAEHYGVFLGRHRTSRARVLLVDRRSSRGYLPRDERLLPAPGFRALAAAGPGEDCAKTCQGAGLRCDEEQLHFVNNCTLLKEHFGCRWCAHQVGEELPAFVVGGSNMNVGQCLVTFISPPHCGAQHPDTRRLCGCIP
eukprot:SRR837773.4636.p3 GENE.SRR837773.4636~~SRR837773.4636.p3  ORF type:complete len:216 (-),score=57.65 SRR837773.4636:669-1292(-)